VKVAAHRAVALIVALAFASGTLAACAGWQSTAAARAACCQDDGTCPDDMSAGLTAVHALTLPDQDAADRCCATGEQHHWSNVQPVAVLHPPADAPLAWDRCVNDAALTPAPSSAFPSGPPLHLRLSVLLV
jgi:hypothetical protein